MEGYRWNGMFILYSYAEHFLDSNMKHPVDTYKLKKTKHIAYVFSTGFQSIFEVGVQGH